MRLFLSVRPIITICPLFMPLRSLGIWPMVSICLMFMPLGWLGNSLGIWAIITVCALFMPLSGVSGDSEGQGGGDDDSGDTHIGVGELKGVKCG